MPIDLTGGGVLHRVVPERWRGSAGLRAALALLAWLPVLLLSAVAGNATGGRVDLPFLSDLVPHARFLIAFPIFIAAGAIIHQQLSRVLSYLWGCSILVGNDRDRFRTTLQETARRYDSVLVDVATVVAAYGVAAWIAHGLAHDGVSTWFAVDTGEGERLTAAGWWYALVGLPLWQTVCFRWGWRILAWWHFLWRLSRMDLRLLPTHPDRAGGLGILSMAQTSLATLLIGVSTVLSATLADEILAGRQTLTGAAPMIGVYVLMCLVMVVFPLFAFAGKLIETKHRGLVEYGDLAQDLFQAFDDKWANEPDERQRELLGDPDPSSLADYGYAYEVVTQMRTLPISRKNIASVAVLALVPFLPLLFLQYSLQETLKWLLGVLG